MLYSTKQVAQLLGVHVQSVKYHVYKSGKCRPQKVAGKLIWRDRDVDYLESVLTRKRLANEGSTLEDSVTDLTAYQLND